MQDDDVIHIGSGEFPGHVVTSKRLTFEGSGAGSIGAFDPGSATLLDATATTLPALELLDGGAVSGLRAQGGSAGSDAVPPAPALRLRAGGAGAALTYGVRGVIGIGGAKGTSGQPGLHLTDSGGSGKPIEASVAGDSYFTTPIGGTALLVEGGNVAATLESSTVAGPAGGTGVQVQSGASLALARANVIDSLGQATGVRATGAGTSLNVGASTIAARSAALSASTSGTAAPTRVTVDGSLLWVRKQAAAGTGAAARLEGAGAGRALELELRNSTLYAQGPQVLGALTVASGVGSHVEAKLANTVARASDTDAEPGDADLRASLTGAGVASITATNSSFSDRIVQGGASVSAPDSGSNVSGDPLFGAPDNGNFVPQAGSPLVDRGDPALVAAGAFDLAGGPRALDGNGDCLIAPDIGAYEAGELSGPCAPRLLVSSRPVRLTRRGLARVKVTCPPGATASCSGTLELRSASKLRRKPKARRRARIAFGRTRLTLDAGGSALVAIRLSRRNRALVRRHRRVRANAIATLEDPIHGQGVTRASLKLLPAPRRLLAAGGALELASSGVVRVRLRCPEWEIEPCAGAVSLLARRRGREPRIGRTRTRVPAGAVSFARVRLSSLGRGLARRSRKLPIRIVVTSGGGRFRSTSRKPARLVPAGSTRRN